MRRCVVWDVVSRKISEFSNFNYYNYSISALLFISYDDEKGPEVYRVDPAGYYRGMKGVSVGVKQLPATSFLEKKIKKKSELTSTEAIELAIEALQTSLGIDVRSKDLEVVVVTKDNSKFTKLTSDQVEHHLNQIANRD